MRNNPRKDLTGLKFNSWLVLNLSHIKVQGSSRRVYWACKCDCGQIKNVVGQSLVSGKSKCCGIKHSNKLEGEGARHNIFSNYLCKAKRRNLEFSLTENEFGKLTKENCYYCGKIPSNIHGNKKFKGDYIYNGLDRVDNNLGYILSNVVPSCKNCNLAKRLLTEQQFFEMIKRVYERHKLNEK